MDNLFKKEEEEAFFIVLEKEAIGEEELKWGKFEG